MPCPTCDHTMELQSIQNHWKTFWCPRCGTLLKRDDPGPGIDRARDRVDVPRLIGHARCLEPRDFQRYIEHDLKLENPDADTP